MMGRHLLPLLLCSGSPVPLPPPPSPVCAYSPDELHDYLLDGSTVDPHAPVMARVMLARHANTLLARGVGGEVLCYAPARVVAGLLHVASSSGPVGRGDATQLGLGTYNRAVGTRPSAQHACGPATLTHVGNASQLWAAGSVGASLDTLRTGAVADPRCCAPFREFSRLFLGGNSPYLNLKEEGQRAAAKFRVLADWHAVSKSGGGGIGSSGGSGEDWRAMAAAAGGGALAGAVAMGSTPDASAEQWRELAGYAAAHALYFGSAAAGSESGGGGEKVGSDPEGAREIFAELVRQPQSSSSSSSSISSGSSNSKLQPPPIGEDATKVLAARRRLLERLEKDEERREREGSSSSSSPTTTTTSSSSSSSFSSSPNRRHRKRSPYAPPPVDEQRFVVATMASDNRPQLAYLRDSARRAGVRLEVLGLGEKYEGHETKLRLYDEFLSREASSPLATLSSSSSSSSSSLFEGVSPWDVVALVDAYDVLLSPSVKHLADRFRRGFTNHHYEYNGDGDSDGDTDADDDGGEDSDKVDEELASHAIVFAAERSLWPDDALKLAYPLRPPRIPGLDAAVWEATGGGGGGGEGKGVKRREERFLNSGTVVGYAWALKFMLRRVRSYGAITLCGPDDQRGFHRFFLEHPSLVGLDYNGALFQTLHFLATPFHMDPTGQAIMGGVPPTKKQQGDRHGIQGGGGSGGGDYGSSSRESAMARWSRTPCAVHGNGGDGKPAYARMVLAWTEALRNGASLSSFSSSSSSSLSPYSPSSFVEVTPPPFSTGIARYIAGDLAGAETAFRAALAEYDEQEADAGGGSPPSLVPGTAEWKLKLDVHYNLGVVLVEQARNAEAAIMYERTLRLDPMHESALLNLAGIYAGTAQWQTADEYIARATAAHPRSKLVASFTAQFRNLQRS
jgi:hypothetical protein